MRARINQPLHQRIAPATQRRQQYARARRIELVRICTACQHPGVEAGVVVLRADGRMQQVGLVDPRALGDEPVDIGVTALDRAVAQRREHFRRCVPRQRGARMFQRPIGFEVYPWNAREAAKIGIARQRIHGALSAGLGARSARLAADRCLGKNFIPIPQPPNRGHAIEQLASVGARIHHLFEDEAVEAELGSTAIGGGRALVQLCRQRIGDRGGIAVGHIAPAVFDGTGLGASTAATLDLLHPVDHDHGGAARAQLLRRHELETAEIDRLEAGTPSREQSEQADYRRRSCHSISRMLASC